MKKHIIISAFLLIFSGNICALDMLLPGKAEKKGLFPTQVEKRQEQLDALNKSIEKYTVGAQDFDEEIKTRLEVIKNKIAEIKKNLQRMPDDEYLNKALTVLNEWYQVVKELQTARDKLIEHLKEHKSIVNDFLQDPEQKNLKKEFLTVGRVYNFEDLTAIREKIDALSGQKATLEEQIKNTNNEIDNKKKAAQVVISEFEQKREGHKQDILDSGPDSFEFTGDQKKQLFSLEEGLYRSKKQLFDLRQDDLDAQRDLLRTRLTLTTLRIDVLNEVFNQVKTSIRITESEVMYARSEHKKKQRALNAKRQDIYDPARERIEQEITQKKIGLKELAKRYNINLNEELTDWSKAPSPTADSWLGYAEVGFANDEILFLERRKDLIDSELSKEEEKLLLNEILIDIQESFLKKEAGRFTSEEKIAQEIQRYEKHKARLQANSATIVNKKNNMQAQLDIQKKALANIPLRIKDVSEQRRIAFKNTQQVFVQVLDQLQGSLQLVNKQVEVLMEVVNQYTDAITTLDKAKEVIEFIVAELESVRVIWQRPEYAISWSGFKRIIPDIERFGLDIHKRALRSHDNLFTRVVKDVRQKPYLLLFLVMQLLVLLGISFLLRKILISIKELLAGVVEDSKSIFKVFGLFAIALATFAIDYFIPVAAWCIAFVFLRLYAISDTVAYILFYLLSIPYLLVLVNRFIASLARSNEWYGYPFVSKELQGRYKVIFSILLYATLVILLFREAFILGNYPKSELPNILLAINFIILQISVIFLIDKDQILNIIPQTNDIWTWIREQIDQYYYIMLLFMVAIIVMINPYVGFGKLVLFVLTHALYTVALVVGFVWIHTALKRSSSNLFFQTDQDNVKERFVGAKTWYGVFIISVLLSLLFFGAIIIAKIWNWPAALSNISSLGDIVSWLKTPLLLSGTDNPISFYTFLQLLFFVLIGFLASFFIKRFVLARIFDVLLVDAGIQYTVTSIMRYLVMLIAIVFGFNIVGLGQQMNYIITAVVFGIAWSFKEPVSDFISYFIILVQRPVKIGDFIRVDSEVTGVVRRITPRSVILRRKNSTMIVVPNSFLMNKAIVNWNYARGFIALNDIMITVSYENDPLRARDVIAQIVDENQFVLKNPKPVIRLDDFGDYGYVFMARCYVSSNYTLDQWNIASDIRLQVVQVFAKEGIKLALPIRVTINRADHNHKEGPHGVSEAPPKPKD